MMQWDEFKGDGNALHLVSFFRKGNPKNIKMKRA